MDWSEYSPYFSKKEFDCKETGENKMDKEFMDELYKLRDIVGFPMVINSGYRSPRHSIERSKGHANGEHTKGRCADIRADGPQAYAIIKAVFKHGLKFNRIGVSQKGGGRFIHLGMGSEGLPANTVWSY